LVAASVRGKEEEGKKKRRRGGYGRKVHCSICAFIRRAAGRGKGEKRRTHFLALSFFPDSQYFPRKGGGEKGRKNARDLPFLSFTWHQERKKGKGKKAAGI